jgi:hypothetical protein
LQINGGDTQALRAIIAQVVMILRAPSRTLENPATIMGSITTDIAIEHMTSLKVIATDMQDLQDAMIMRNLMNKRIMLVATMMMTTCNLRINTLCKLNHNNMTTVTIQYMITMQEENNKVNRIGMRVMMKVNQDANQGMDKLIIDTVIKHKETKMINLMEGTIFNKPNLFNVNVNQVK